MTMIGVPTSTVAPSATSSAATVPAYGIGNSTNDFAVSISTTMSLTLTTSPTATRQVTMSASVRPSPGSGSLNSRNGTVLLQCASERSTASSTRSRSGRNSSSIRLGG